MWSLFRPRLDGLAAPQESRLQAVELEALAEAQRDAAARAGEMLAEMYGAMAGRPGVAQALADEAEAPIAPRFALDAARAVAAFDHFATRMAPPRFEIGGLASARNRAIAERLRPFLVARLLAASAAAAEQAALWRTIARAVPEQWISDRAVRRIVATALAETEAFERAEVALDLRMPCAGGDAWLRQTRTAAWHRLRGSLAAGRPALIALIRSDDAAIETPLAVAYAWEERPAGAVALRVYLPAWSPGGTVVTIVMDGGDVAAIACEADARDGAERDGYLGFAVLDLAPARPPPFGWRARIGWPVPWRALWWLRRHVAIWLGRAPP